MSYELSGSGSIGMMSLIKNINSGKNNEVFSPAILYSALVVLAAISEGETQEEILHVLNVNAEQLKDELDSIWSVSASSRQGECTLGNAVWLNDKYSANKELLDALIEKYYAEVYPAEMGSAKTDADIKRWLDAHTGNMLQDATSNVSTSAEDVIRLFSAIYLSASWVDKFNEFNNSVDKFYGGHTSNCVYMNAIETGLYCDEKSFYAVEKDLTNGCSVRFLLPKEGHTTSDLYKDSKAMRFMMGIKGRNCTDATIRMQIPKLDMTQNASLDDKLQELGIHRAFDERNAEIKLVPNAKSYLSGAYQVTRVKINEDGAEAASFVDLACGGLGFRPREIKEFILNRPFIYVIAADSIPLIVGTVTDMSTLRC